MVNRAILIGRAGKEPEVRKTSSGKNVITFTLATSEYYKDLEGNKQENTVWHNIVKYGNPKIADFISKGSKLYVEGKINNRSYEKESGKKIYISEIIVSNIVLLDSKPTSSIEKKVDSDWDSDNIDDDIPF